MNSPQNIKTGKFDIQATTVVLNKKAEIDMKKEYRCPGCKRLLLKGKIIQIETRCPKCKKICRIKEL